MTRTARFGLVLLASAWLALAGSGSARGQLEDIWDATIQAGLSALAKQDLRAAQRAFERAVRDARYIDSDRHVVSLNLLGNTLYRLGDYAGAEATLRRALRIVDEIPGITVRERAAVTNNLASVVDAQGRLGEAEDLYRRSLELQMGMRPVNSAELFSLLVNLAGIEERLKRPRRAEWLYRVVLGLDAPDRGGAEDALERRIRAAVAGSGAPPQLDTSITAYNNLGILLARDRRFEEAEVTLARAEKLSSGDAALATEAASAAHNHGVVLARLGRAEEATASLNRALSARVRLLGDDHPDIAFTRYAISRQLVARGDASAALSQARAASALLERRLAESATWSGGTAARIALMRGWREGFETHLSVLAALRDHAGDGWADEAFRAMQLAKASETAAAVAGATQRFAAGDPALAEAMRQHQDATAERRATEKELTRIAALPPEQRERGALDRLQRSMKSLDEILDRLSRQTSGGETAPGAVVPLGAAQATLRTDEALLAYILGEERSYLQVTTRQGSDLLTLEIAGRELAALIRRVRDSLDIGGNPVGRPYPADASYELFQRLLAPARARLEGIREIVLVTDGELETLPLAVLLTQRHAATSDPSLLRQYSWLIRDYALASVPSVDAWVRLRGLRDGAADREPFIAFANPVLAGSGAGARYAALRASQFFRGGAIADVSMVRSLAPLPETEDEVRAIARLLGAPSTALHLREAASETQVKALPLHRYKVVMFASHALLAGEIAGIAEPALVLTPPVQGSARDDGLLTAGEIARLKLDADWVILSACNTAAGDGTPGGEGFSGLARAFFHAGARALLVSHWPVASEPTVALTTRMFEVAGRDRKLTRAGALRESMLEMIDRSPHAAHAHPLFWAPFVLVGNSAP